MVHHAIVLLLTSTALANLPERWVATPIDVPETYAVASMDLDETGQVCGWVQLLNDGQFSFKPFFWDSGVASVEDTGLHDARSLLLDSTGRAFGIALDPNMLFRVGQGKVYALAELGEFAGLGELIGRTDDFTVSGNLTKAGFVWTPSHGLEHLPGDTWNRATIADCSDAVGAVGTIDLTHGPDERAFRYVPQGGALTELLPNFNGPSRALATDEAGRVLIVRTHADGRLEWLLHYPLLDSDDVVIHTVFGSPLNGDARANDVGGIALSWNQVNQSPQLAWWAPGSTAPTAITLPPDMLGIQLTHVTNSGLIVGLLLSQDYLFSAFIARHGDGLRILEHRVIGFPSLTHTDIRRVTESGHMLFGGPGLYDQKWILTAAADGDVNGDGLVNVTDVLLIVAAWGVIDADDPCGPDLDLDGDVDADDLLQTLSNWS